MNTTVLGGSLHGIDARLVQVEVDISPGLPATRTVGLPEAAAREGNERVRAAIHNSGFAFPCKRITINLAPADIRKKGSSLDLAVAVAIVAGSSAIDVAPLEGWVLYGELGLDGRVRPAPGALAAAMTARAAGLAGLIVAPENAAEASAIEGVAILTARTLGDVVAHLRGERPLPRHAGTPGSAAEAAAPRAVFDLAEVKGQAAARRALEIAAAGSHNVLLIGPPGAGKTMLARCLPGILPPLTHEEAIEVTRIHGAIGTGLRSGLMRRRPFRSPHHTVSNAALVGGGAQARPGEVSLAHHGVLFLDEMPEFRPEALDVLRQPLEEGFVTVARSARTLCYPAAFMLVGAMNPCRCGHLGDTRKPCRCNPRSIARYRGRISGPLLDRIDLHVEVPAVPYRELSSEAAGERSSAVAGRVAAARRIQSHRYAGACRAVSVSEVPRSMPGAGRHPDQCRPIEGAGHREAAWSVGISAERTWVAMTNARAPATLLRACAAPDVAGRRILETAMSRLALSARAHDRILRIARTIADLEGTEAVKAVHIAEALQHRCLDRPVQAVTALP